MGFDDLPLQDRLLHARRGTAYFAQRLAELSDAELDGETLLPGWSRRHLVAHVGYNAAALCRLMEWAATGSENPMYASPEQRGQEIQEGSTLPAAALRNLFDHTVARLDEKWRHAPDASWNERVRTAQGREVPASETAWMRSREVWIHAVDLNNDGRFGDFPDIVLDSLLADIVGMWRKKGLGAGVVLAADESTAISVESDSEPTVTVTGPKAAVVRWAAGRGSVGVTVAGRPAEPPPWL